MQPRPALWLSACVTASAAACKLDLDESLIDRDGGAGSAASGGSAGSPGGAAGAAGGGAAGATGGTAGGGSAGVGATGGGGSAGGAGGPTGGSAGVPEGGAPCDASGQCAIEAGACLQGTCLNGTCSAEICPGSSACEARACDEGTGTCGAPVSLSFHAGTIDVGDVLACGATQCFAAAGDFVVVGTAGGLKGWRVTNPLDAESVAIEQPPFAITRIAASGTRVLLLGPAAAGKLSLAWIDVPAGPTPQLAPIPVAVNFTDSIHAVYPSSGGSFFLVEGNPGSFWPAALLTPPIVNNATVTMLPSTGIPAGASIVAASGSRLVSYRTRTDVPGVFDPSFSLETSAGTASAQNGGEQSVQATAGNTPTNLAAHVFASHATGSVGWATNEVDIDEGGAASASKVAFRWPLLGADTVFDGARRVTLESYPAGNESAQLAGPCALLDDATAIVTAADPANTSNTAVRVVRRNGAALELGAGRFVLPFSPQQIGVAASGRYGFVLTPSTTTPPSAPDTTVHVFAPSCP